ncbi:MAG: hypothetical protein VB875_18490 [Pirellulales bacterium]
MISVPANAAELLEREFLEVRAKLLQVAATFDRLDRTDGCVNNDARMQGLRQALEILQSDTVDRAEQIQLLFSREYEDDWQTRYEMPEPR